MALCVNTSRMKGHLSIFGPKNPDIHLKLKGTKWAKFDMPLEHF